MECLQIDDLGGTGGGDQEDGIGEGRRNTTVYQRLCHAVFNPRLDLLAQSKAQKLDVGSLNKHYTGKDLGTTNFFPPTKDSAYRLPRDQVNLTTYITHISVKMQYLAGQYSEIYIGRKRRLLVFYYWPATL